MHMMRLRGVWTTNLTGFLIGFGMYSSFVLIPQFVETPKSTGYGFGSSVTQAGLFMIPSTMMMLISAPVGGRMSMRSGSKVPLVLGSCLTLVAFVLLTLAHSEHWQVYLSSVLLGCGRRILLRLDGEPDRRGGAAGSDRSRDRDERRHANDRRCDRWPGCGQPARGNARSPTGCPARTDTRSRLPSWRSRSSQRSASALAVPGRTAHRSQLHPASRATARPTDAAGAQRSRAAPASGRRQLLRRGPARHGRCCRSPSR